MKPQTLTVDTNEISKASNSPDSSIYWGKRERFAHTDIKGAVGVNKLDISGVVY